MVKLVPIGFWVTVAAYLTLAGTPLTDAVVSWFGKFLPSMATILDSLFGSRTIAIGVAFVVSLFLWRPVWRKLWKLPLLGRYLEATVFPDLNGKWQIEIESNWPVVKALADAAKDRFHDPVDVIGSREQLPQLLTSRFVGKIDQGWGRINLTVLSNDQSPLRESRTISFDLLSATGSERKRVAWTFRQENLDVSATDEDNFLGSALLDVESKDLLSGHYWNNRSWRLGLNAAGRIRMSRLPDCSNL